MADLDDVFCAQNLLVKLVNHVNGAIWPPSNKPYYPFLSKLADTGRPVNELVATVVGLAIGSSVNYCQGVSSFIWRACAV